MLRQISPAALLMPWVCAAMMALPARAAMFCENSVSGLEDAFNTAETNNQDDEIRIGEGVFSAGLGFKYVPPASETFDLTISGGWNVATGCTNRTLIPDQTALGANDGGRSLFIQVYAGDITVENLSINEDGGLIIFARNDPGVVKVTVDRVKFLGNSGGVSPAIRFLDLDELRFRNNRVQNNFSDAATLSIVALNAPSRIYLINNTFRRNFIAPIGGLELIDNASTEVLIVNNLFWDNEGTDIDFRGHGQIIMKHNNFQTLNGIPDKEVNSLSVDPRFEFTIYPRFDSPMVDAGTQPPFFLPIDIPFEDSWKIGPLDHEGADRVQGAQVDIGAIEVFPEIIFADGYE